VSERSSLSFYEAKRGKEGNLKAGGGIKVDMDGVLYVVGSPHLVMHFVVSSWKRRIRFLC